MDWDCFSLHTYDNFLKSVVMKCIRQPPEPQDLANYVCSSMEGAFANDCNDISNI